ncbi:MAG: flagellar hook-associated protein FlgL [Oxalobacteraceae bacterium]|jgi:flagellar hook-associated protein 3 FlgL|nr:flagellar hook-associated protein FlgL [Oxalobacteraceae bacterium]
MQVSTSLMFERAITQMGITQDRLSKTQTQLSTTKQINKPSDAPDQAATVTRLKSAIDRQNSYVATINSVKDKLSQQETTANNATDILVRLKELTVQAANDTYSAVDRKSIDIEVRQLRDQLLSLANTQDVNGNFIFSGSRVGKQAFASDENGKLVYQGDQTVSATGVGDQSSVDINRSGTNPFDKIVRDDGNNKKTAVGFFQVIDDLSAALQSNNAASIKRAVGEVQTLQQGLSDSLASIGAATNKIDNQAALAEENVLRMKSTLSQVEDTDYTQAIANMNKDMLALQAAQTSFAKISQLNLFDYIK